MMVHIESGVVGQAPGVQWGFGPNGEPALMIAGSGGSAVVVFTKEECRDHAAQAGWASVQSALGRLDASGEEPDPTLRRSSSLVGANGQPLMVSR